MLHPAVFAASLLMQSISPEAALKRGVASYRAGEYAQAVTALEQAVKQAPRDAECQWSLGGALMAQWIPGFPTEENAAFVVRASSAFKAALEIEPWTRTALASLGSLEFQQGRVAIGDEARAAHFDQAESWYRQIRELYPDDKSGFYPRGVIAWERHRADEAVTNLRQALILDPHHDATVQHLDAALRAKQEVKEADRMAAQARDMKRRRQEKSTSRMGMFSSPGQTKRPTRIWLDPDAAEENIRQKPELDYPPQARAARVQGVVRFRVVIANTGEVLEAKLVGGHPLLVAAATEAVRKYVYRPVLLDGQQVEITTILF